MLTSLNFGNYSAIFDKYNISHIETELYFESDNLSSYQGWVFYIPISKIDFHSLLEKIFPFIIENGIYFKICKNDDAYKEIWSEHRGLSIYGQVICLYPNEQASILEFAKKLILITEGYKGGIVYKAARLGDLLFTNYKTSDNIHLKNENPSLEKEPLSDNVPPLKFDGADWPFSELASPQNFAVREEQILLGKYKVLSVLSSSVKGLVIKASYSDGVLFKKIRYCIIKMGLKGMCMDWWGRDILDRLQWQETVQKQLYKRIGMPKILDRFDEGGSQFLIMEFIQGQTLFEYQRSLIGFCCWEDIDSKYKRIVLSQILQVVKKVKKMHHMGFVHRDLTYANIMVDKNSNLIFIDLELAYSKKENFPDPPFRLGTLGFMSPEQERFSSPEFNQDIYYIGTLMLSLVTRLLPSKFDKSEPRKFFNSLMYFIGDIRIVELIVFCITENPMKRPTLEFIENRLKEIIRRPNFENIDGAFKSKVEKNQIISTIQGAINNLSNPKVRTKSGLWSSPVNPITLNMERVVFDGLYNGVSGILYIISVATCQGYDTSRLEFLIIKHVEYLIKKEVLFEKENFGLYNGIHGIAVGLAMLVKSDLIHNIEMVRTYIGKCFYKLPKSSNIVNGIAGVGIALIHCRNFFDDSIFKNKLTLFCDDLIGKQNSDGGWKFEDIELNTEETFTGFEIGNAGVIWFLYEAGAILLSKKIIGCATAGIQWLINNSFFDGKRYNWNINSSKNGKGMLFGGSIGICLTFIKAFEITGNITYKRITENVLYSRPDRIVMFEDQFASGLPGLGEVYLEAFKIFKQDIWYERAEWIAGLYVNSAITKDDYIWWLQQDSKEPFVDLMMGNGAIVHFLLRFINPIDVRFNIFHS